MAKMTRNTEDFLALDDAALLRQCDLHAYKSSGPGGQHRNKVSSAIRLRHHPTGIAVHGDDSRSQHENKAAALRRLRMNIACRVRRPVDTTQHVLPPIVRECIFRTRGGTDTPRRMQIGRKDRRFWQVVAFLLDVLDCCQGRLADAAAYLCITTSNMVSLLQEDRHLLAAAQAIRKTHGQRPLL